MIGDKIAGATLASAGPPDAQDATEPVAPVQPEQIELPVGDVVMAAPPPLVVAPSPPVVAEHRPAPPEARPSTAAAPEQAQTTRLDEIEARMGREVEAMREARVELQTRARQERDRSRLAYLRDVGATDTLRDDHLLSLAPDFDPTTADGRVELDRWREANATLFQARGMTGVQVADKVISNVPSSRHGTFGARLAKKIATETFGG